MSMSPGAKAIARALVEIVEQETGSGRCAIEDDGSVELRMRINQVELGEAAGTLGREYTVKALAELRARGAIKTGRMKYWVRDIDELRALAADKD